MMTPEQFRAALVSLDMSATQLATMMGVDDSNLRKALRPGDRGPTQGIAWTVTMLLVVNEIRAAIKDGRPELAMEICERALWGEVSAEDFL